MFAHPTKTLPSAGLALMLVGVCIAPLAFARILTNTIDAVAIVTDNNRRIRVPGPLACSVSEPAYIRVTVTQRSTGALAEGIALITCTTDVQRWTVHASTQGNATFQEGPAVAVALARTTDR